MEVKNGNLKTLRLRISLECSHSTLPYQNPQVIPILFSIRRPLLDTN